MYSYVLVIMSKPIMALLSKDVLTDEKFPKWKSNPNIVLVSESIRFILTEEKPAFHNSTASRVQREEYDRWNMDNSKTMAYMLASISDTFRTKLEGKETVVFLEIKRHLVIKYSNIP